MQRFLSAPYLAFGKQHERLFVMHHRLLGVSQVEAGSPKPFACLPLPKEVIWTEKGEGLRGRGSWQSLVLAPLMWGPVYTMAADCDCQ